MEEIYMDEEKKKQDDRSGLMIGGSILIGIGLLFLLINLDVLPNMGRSWPIIIIVIGIALIIGGFGKKKKNDEINIT
jgi:multisubunit Na+/H+ antiporter MnhB subunit